MSKAIRHAIAKVIEGEDLTREEAHAAMTCIMRGEATPAQIGAYLVALRMKGETVDEIVGSAQAMRESAVRIHPEVNGQPLVDTCGTGGDGRGTFNISTTAAFVVAATGRPVAKHGNRSVSSRSGSADVLAALGANLNLTPDQVRQCIEEVGIGFLFAPRFHPAMKHAIGPRRELGVRTIFNILGPLTNPAGATHQVMGVFAPHLTEPLAHVLGQLGVQAAYVVHGHGGLDELSTTGPNRVSLLRAGQVTTFDLDPADLGFRRARPDDLRGGDATTNARITRAILAGEERGPKRDVVLLNAAAVIAAETGDWDTALVEVQEALDSGRALAILENFVQFTQRLAAAKAHTAT